jgi:hypothetical protein
MSAPLFGTATASLELIFVSNFFQVEALTEGHDASWDLYSCTIFTTSKETQQAQNRLLS